MALNLTTKDLRKGLKVFYNYTTHIGDIIHTGEIIDSTGNTCNVQWGKNQCSYTANSMGVFPIIYIYATILPSLLNETITPGEILLVRSSDASSFYRIGDEVLVEKELKDGFIKIKGNPYSLHKSSFARLPSTTIQADTPAAKEPGEIKVGSTVEVIDAEGGHKLKLGQILTISRITSERYYIKFPEGDEQPYFKRRFKLISSPSADKLPEKIIPGCIVTLKACETSHYLEHGVRYNVLKLHDSHNNTCCLKEKDGLNFAVHRFDIVGYEPVKDSSPIKQSIKTSQDGNTNPGESTDYRASNAVKVQPVKAAVIRAAPTAGCAVRSGSRPNICIGSDQRYREKDF